MEEKKYDYKSGANTAGHSRCAEQCQLLELCSSLLPVTNANVYTEIVALWKIDCLLIEVS